MDPTVWGPGAWRLLHTITFNYPECPDNKTKEDTKAFFLSFGNVIPCDKCRVNFAHHLKVHPLTDDVLKTKENLVNWLVDVHNDVNKMLGKKLWSYQEVYKKYNELYNPYANMKTQMFIVVSVFMFVLLSVVVWMFWKD